MFQVGDDEDSATDHRSPITDHRFLSSVWDRPCSFASPAPGVTTLVTAPLTSVAGSGAVRGSAGSVTAKVEPDPTRLSTMIRPRCISTIDLTMARPSPLPLLRASLARDPR